MVTNILFTLLDKCTPTHLCKFIEDFLEKSSKKTRFNVHKLDSGRTVRVEAWEDVKTSKNNESSEFEKAKNYPTQTDVVLDFIPGQRGNSLLFYNGFTFAKNNKCGDTVYWCCRSRKVGKPACRARISTSRQENGTFKVVVTKPHHNHGPSARMLKKIEKCIKT